MMRHCCGSNDHPDSDLFIQMYKLISTYSLIKPPKGSNVSSNEVIQVLLSIKDIPEINERQEKWNAEIDSILDKGLNVNAISDAAELLEEHDYFQCSTSDYVLAYISRFVARKGSRFARFKNKKDNSICENCLTSLRFGTNEMASETYKLIQIKSKGYLIEPSIELFNLISILERATLKVLNTQSIDAETIFHITAAVEDLSPLPFVGCDEHKMDFTHKIISFYLTTRMFFISKQANKNDCIEKERTREKRKLSKLSSNKDELYQEHTEEIKIKKRRKNDKKTKTKANKKEKTCKKSNKKNI